jgi:D-alanyl-lipoteichoic acid acyltransferase DltB (MBOAT superfamily)
MQLLSWSYLVFFALVFALYWALPNGRPRQLSLAAATLVWYCFGVWWHAIVAILIGTTSYLTAQWISHRPPERRGIPTLVGVAIPIGYFLFFRYFAQWSGLRPGALPWWAPNPLLAPFGLSFMMFEAIAIQADLFFGRLERPGSWWSHIVFTLYFPTRMIGPMRKYQTFVAQVGAQPRPNPEMVANGLSRIGIGLVKKVVVANPIGTFALFNMRPEMMFEGASAIPLILGLYAYWFFLYFDFAGYSDIVIGTSILLGIEVPENFNAPYRATNVSEYWQRWHMSLSFWVRDYIYTPAAIAWRRSMWGAPAGAFLSMLVLGLWHGIELRYVAFGAFHGVWLGGYMLYRDRLRRRAVVKRLARSSVWRTAGWGVTLNLAILSHVFYATPNFRVAMLWVRTVLHALIGT